MSTNDSKRILLELLEIDEQDTTLGVIRQRVLHHAEDSLRDVQRTYLSSTFYAMDAELWFNQIETQFDLHQINDDDERYSLTCAALSGEVASDVRDVLLQPFRSHKYESLKSILIERRGLTTPERVNKVISGERMGSDIP